ncbi:hypothetical protein ASC97_29140 [Rhizobium sp. Root1203]|uniref:TauD/TfdA family dioxygenase n=1 Tax=Rhizobium sp. Root1203 TaxID=1736427 RepID=UPI00070B707E|nr:TauD/TfdA family dioxygenase [Rhizobium sp. Root1203]KQV19738.1 hypothetical protein ASC97_29140 [Rhizobium sp. Root1203]
MTQNALLIVESETPLIIKSRNADTLQNFVTDHAREIESKIAEHGAVLLRGYKADGDNTLAALFESLWSTPSAYVYRSTPRTNVGNGVYTATEYPKNQEIPMHNENAYQRDWPTRIGFHCVTPADTGGQTPLANVSYVTARLDPAVVSVFRERGVSYVRNYSEFVDLPWQTVFQTDSKSDVEEFCVENDIAFEWTDEGLRTQQVCQGTAIHPENGEELWFNQAQLFHVSSLGPEMAASMIDTFGVRGLPRNAYFGNGEAIPDDVIAHVTHAFEQEKIIFNWLKDDVLLLDNMRFAHGRRPFTGARRVLVSMGRPFSGVTQQ